MPELICAVVKYLLNCLRLHWRTASMSLASIGRHVGTRTPDLYRVKVTFNGN